MRTTGQVLVLCNTVVPNSNDNIIIIIIEHASAHTSTPIQAQPTIGRSVAYRGLTIRHQHILTHSTLKERRQLEDSDIESLFLRVYVTAKPIILYSSLVSKSIQNNVYANILTIKDDNSMPCYNGKEQ